MWRLASFAAGLLIIAAASAAAVAQDMPAADPDFAQGSAPPSAAVLADAHSATATYLARVPAERRERTAAYAVGGYWIGLWSSVIIIMVMALLLHLGWSRRIRDRVERLSRWRANQTLAGLFGTQRIVLNDNLLERGTVPEIRTVMAHEIGHFVLSHLVEQLFRAVVFIALAFLLLRWGFDRATRRWGARWGVRDIGDVAGLPLLVLLFTAISLLGTPIVNSFNRQDEVEADLFALNAAREPDGAATVLLKMGEFRKLDPTPLEEALFYRHPSPRDRIHQAMVWKATWMRAGAAP